METGWSQSEILAVTRSQVLLKRLRVQGNRCIHVSHPIQRLWLPWVEHSSGLNIQTPRATSIDSLPLYTCGFVSVASDTKEYHSRSIGPGPLIREVSDATHLIAGHQRNLVC